MMTKHAFSEQRVWQEGKGKKSQLRLWGGGHGFLLGSELQKVCDLETFQIASSLISHRGKNPPASLQMQRLWEYSPLPRKEERDTDPRREEVGTVGTQGESTERVKARWRAWSR